MSKLKIGYIGLGKMGMNMVLRMREKGVNVIAYNRSEAPRDEARKAGIKVMDSLVELVSQFSKPRTLWLMISNSAVDEVLSEILKYLERGDTVIDGGNSLYKDSIRRAAKFSKKGINFLDAGVSGGPKGARDGACIMVGGKKEIYEKYQDLFKKLSAPQAFAYMGKAGAGHFVKMVHNGIEYGMMQALAEGFAVLRNADLRGLNADKPSSARGFGRAQRGKIKFGLDLKKIAELYNNRSVIESRLVGWLEDAYKKYGDNLKDISGTVAHTGEGEWTVEAAKSLGIPVPIIEGAFKFRVESAKKPSYTGQVLSALRNQFGGHDIK